MIYTAVGVLRDSPPVSWQDIAGARVPVESRYVTGDGDGDTVHSFAVGSYDPAHELVIDPGLDYSTFIGGSNGENVGGIAVDAQGNAYIVGYTSSADLPTTPGAFDTTFNGGGVDVFVSKLSADGSSLVYTTYLGGTPTPLRRGSGDPWEFGRAIAVDADGHAFVAGQTTSNDFPITSGAFQTSINVTGNPDDATDGFVTKLNPSGSGLVYSTYLGGTNFEDVDGITIDAQGNAYVTGRTLSNNFPTTPGAFQASRASGYDAFITKLNPNGSDVVYSTYLGGTDNEVVENIVVDAGGNAWLAGGTSRTDAPTTEDAFSRENSGMGDVWFGLLSADGSQLLYGTYFGGVNTDGARGIALDADGNVYLAGNTQSFDFPTTQGAFQTTLHSVDPTIWADAFVVKFGSGTGIVNPPPPRLRARRPSPAG